MLLKVYLVLIFVYFYLVYLRCQKSKYESETNYVNLKVFAAFVVGFVIVKRQEQLFSSFTFQMTLVFNPVCCVFPYYVVAF